MHATDTGLYRLTHDSALRIGASLTDTRLTLVAFQRVATLDGLAVTDMATLAAPILEGPSDAGVPKSFFPGYAIEDPGTPGALLAYRSHMAFDLTDLQGADEIVDYSRFEIPVDDGGMLSTWDNRLITSRWDKNEYGRRNRAKRGAAISCYVWMPIATGSFIDTRIILPFAGSFGFGGTADPALLAEADAPSDARGYLRYYWSASVPDALTVAPDGWINIPLQLVENADGAPLAHATRLKLEVLSGYVPQSRVLTDAQGRAVIRACALGLRPGETLSLKINTDHYTAVGRVDVAVV
jgi:hypothetical protein